MRKFNSEIKTAFMDQMGTDLNQNENFTFVELEDYACYCIIDGISILWDSESAALAAKEVMHAFMTAPSISKKSLKRYLQTVNRELLNCKGYEKQRASITIVVTNYESIRYAHAGNTRLRFYRDSRQLYASRDMSLAQEMLRKEVPDQREQNPDVLSKHEERNNLYSYLGMEHFTPFVSGKIKLRDMDIITLYNRGIWENIREADLDDLSCAASGDPNELCDKVHQLMEPLPKEFEKLLFAAIFIEKVYQNPNRKKKVKKIVIISLIIIAVLLVIAIVVFLVLRARERTREEMNMKYRDMLEYIEDENFPKADEECGIAAELAGKLYDREMREDLSEYQKLLEAMMTADGLFEEGDYIEAEKAYLNARARSRWADNAGLEYIELKLTQINRYRDVFDHIAIGDRLLEEEEYELAEEKYLTAKEDAAFIYFESGKQQANDALEKLYDEWTAARDEATALEEKEAAAREEEAAARTAELSAAAEMVAEGDGVFKEGDFDGAMVFYLIALEKYSALEDTVQITKLNKKIIELNDKQAAVKEREQEARLFQEQAQIYMEEGEYQKAKEQYQYAQTIYQELGQDNKADEIQGKMDMTDTKAKLKEQENAAGGAGTEGKSVSGNEG